MYVHCMIEGVHEGQKRHLIPGAGIAAGCAPPWVLRTELEFSARAVELSTSEPSL